jgi:hypothetical protein
LHGRGANMNNKFKLKPGETKVIDVEGKKYKIFCDLFSNHNHDEKPLYYYHDEMKGNDLVATVESDDHPPYNSPYSNTITADWTVFREEVIINFSKKDDYLVVTIATDKK